MFPQERLDNYIGALGGPLGLNGGAAGSGFAAPTQADITNPLTNEQLPDASRQSNLALEQQNQLLEALKGAGGIQKQNDVYGQLGNLASQYGNIASGQGPNPAQAMLNQQTGQNVANQAALMAGQRGAGSNVGLMARQAAQQGAATQQQAVGQGAVMQANQSLGALNQMGNIYGQQAGIGNAQVTNQIGQTNATAAARQAQQANLLNAMGAYNNAKVGMQSNVNQGNTALAGQEMQQGESAVGGFFKGGGSSMFAAMGADGGEVSEEEGVPVISPPSSGGEFTQTSGTVSGGAPINTGSYTMPNSVMQNSAKGGMIMADGGEVKGPQSEFGQFVSSVSLGGIPSTGSYVMPNSVMQSGGDSGPAPAPAKKKQSAPASNVMTDSGGSGQGPTVPGSSSGIGSYTSGVSGAAGPAFDKGGMVDVVVSPGEKIVPPEKVNQAAGGKVEARTVPGRANVPGDSLKNDVVKTKLPVGTVVVPRTKAKDQQSTISFVQATLAKRGRKK